MSKKTLLSSVDGLPVREVGPWSKEKHLYLRKYINAASTAMKDKRVHYIDLFAGPGRCVIRDTTEEIEGSPLIAAQVTTPFHKLHLGDLDSQATQALQTRLAKLSLPASPAIHTGDANLNIDLVCQEIPRRDNFCIFFIDPYSVSFHYESLRKVRQLWCDLIIYFPDRVDLTRNFDRYAAEEGSRLDLAMGFQDWRDRINEAPPRQRTQMLRNIFAERVAALGWKHHSFVRVPQTGQGLYVLFFFSRSDFALKLWHNTHAIGPGQQRNLPF